MGHNKIVDLPTPTSEFDAVNKAYADSPANFSLRALTTTQRNTLTPSAGAMIYNTTLAKLNYFNGVIWKSIADAYIYDDFVVGANCTMCLSLRKLGTWGGNCCRVIRVSDNAEQDIGFDANGLMDKVAFDAFIGVSTAKVRTIYDQSGNSNNGTANAVAPATYIVMGAVG